MFKFGKKAKAANSQSKTEKAQKVTKAVKKAQGDKTGRRAQDG